MCVFCVKRRVCLRYPVQFFRSSVIELFVMKIYERAAHDQDSVIQDENNFLLLVRLATALFI